jgi:hypothetical protein
VAADLTSIALKFSGPNITAAISCLAHLAAYITHSPLALLRLADKCFSAIATVAKSVTTEVPSSSSRASTIVSPLQVRVRVGFTAPIRFLSHWFVFMHHLALLLTPTLTLNL